MRALPPPGVDMPAVISADVKAFLSQPHVAALATVRPDGRPHVTPVWYDFDGSEFPAATRRRRPAHRGVAARAGRAVGGDRPAGGVAGGGRQPGADLGPPLVRPAEL